MIKYQITELLRLWPEYGALAEQISTDDEPVPVSRLYQWANANKIHHKYHKRILAAARERGVIELAEKILTATSGKKPKPER